MAQDVFVDRSEVNVHQIAITEDNVSDEANLNAMLAIEANVDCVIADHVYFGIAPTGAWSTCGVLPVISPPANAVVHHQLATRWHTISFGTLRTRASMHSANKYGYGQRASAESQISRIKRCIGWRYRRAKSNRSSATA
ncbi:hypothetical protein G3O00_42305 [Burkholderia sp. Ac-20384]|uniref:hypothetical protein n=1 Tax=Burkholderia sp. Ac-20384 TaxID=2703902 RepID=UPI0019821B13|nr:hypothetical protein [Burkholderia sp. Ac-20384]MBN3830137.1 hypothetical protein [Burkholderia sp. Ac-20384]